ncbi:protein translocase subunit SecF [Methanoregula formicica]|uniref:Protein-export membrane protein SecF n=1 Tax=Methanoregula formicica (strain DSM 22288 / NBRC 105244 / SMSP) TaxID=593750 RepID=L0HEC7_METFS|nr:protein translocase subunit SecF [Methanoregula formicica]AGB02370.1 preprotein translocase subunit SecF [Methanoregula formicica SMSP]
MGLINYNIEKYSPKQLVVIPLVLLVLSLLFIGFNMMSTGMPVTPGLDFSGGTAVTIRTTDTQDDLRAVFAGYPLTEISDMNDAKFLKFGTMDDAQSKSLVTLVGQKYPDASISQISETFGKSLQYQAFIALIFSFIGMAIVVFLSFRTFVPSVAVVLSAFADIVMTAAAMNLVGITLTLGTTAALLMLIGYSVDSDILLTNRVLKRQGKLQEKLAGAFHTGIVMTSTTFAAITALFIVSWIGSIQILMEISAVLLIGLLFDVINTWLTNAAILKWYVQKGGVR